MFLNLGLGRMGCLVGALGISAALDLNFASGTFPPQVTHSRSSSATQVYSDGLVDFAPENLLLYSRTLSNGAWTGSNRTISDNTTADPPDTTNGTTADTIVENTAAAAFHWIAQAVTKPAVAERYLFTGYCHSSSARDIAVYLQNGANGCNARFRPSTGVNTGPAATFGSGWSSVSSSITSIGGGWHRFALQATSDGTTSITAQIALYNAAFSYTGDGTSGAVVYGLRLQRGTHSRAEDDFLLQTTSAAVYGPRITYDPSSLACLGYLNEPQRTNLLLNSATLSTQNVAVSAQEYTLSFYGTGTVTLTAASTAGPLVGTGAYPNRVTLTFTPSAGILTVTVSGSVTNAQLEAGSTASSWIPTTGTSATRAADVAYVDVATWLPALSITNATFYARIKANAADISTRVMSTDAGGTSLVEINNFFEVGSWDGTGYAGITGGLLIGNDRQVAVSLASGARVLAYGGATTSSASNGLSATTRIYIGSEAGVSNYFNGTFAECKAFYGAQSAGQIATLTT